MSLDNSNFDEIKFNTIRNHNKYKRKLLSSEFKNLATRNINESSVMVSIVREMGARMKYDELLDSCINNLKVVSASSDMINFYDNVDSVLLGSKSISITLRDTNEISKVNPQYLYAYTRELHKYIKNSVVNAAFDTYDVISSNMTASELENRDRNERAKRNASQPKFTLSKLMKKYRKRIISSSAFVDIYSRIDLPDDDIIITKINPAKSRVYKIDAAFVNSDIKPFVQNFNKIKINLINEALELKKAVIDCQNELNAITEISLQKLEKYTSSIYYKGTIDVNYIIMYSVEKTAELLTYCVGMMTERISAYVYNLNQYSNLYNTIINFNQKNKKTLQESVIDIDIESMTDDDIFNNMITRDVSFIRPYVTQLSDKIQFEIDNLNAYNSDDENVYDTYYNGMNHDDYDNYHFMALMGYLNKINNNLRNMLELSKVDEDEDGEEIDYSVDEILEKSEIRTLIDSMDKVVEKIKDISCYTNAINSPDTKLCTLKLIKNEMLDAGNNIEEISSAIYCIHQNLMGMKSDYENNPNGLYGSPEKAEELYDYTVSYIHKIRKGSADILKAFISRLKSINEIFKYNDLDEPTEVVPYVISDEIDSTDYVEEAFQSILDEDAYFERASFESLIRQYNFYQNKLERGVVILYEADTPSNNTSNNANNNNNNSNASNKAALSGAWAKFKSFVKNIISKFKKKSKDIQVSGKIDYITKNEQEILNKINANTECSIRPYYPAVNPDIYTNDMKQFENNINNLTDDDIRNATSADSIREKVYAFMKTKSIGNYSMSKDFKSFCSLYYSSGSNQDDYTKGKTASGDDLKKAITTEIQFTKEYFATASTIANTCNRILKKLDDRLTNMNAVNKEEVDKAEKQDNQQQNNDNNSDNQNQSNQDNQQQDQNNNQQQNSNNSNNQQQNSNNNNSNNSNQQNNNSNNQQSQKNNQNNKQNNNGKNKVKVSVRSNNNSKPKNINASYYEPILSDAVLYEEVVDNQQNSGNNNDNNNSNNNTNTSNNQSQSNNVSIEERIGWITGDCRLFETCIMTVVEKRFFSDSKLFFNIIKGNTNTTNNNDNNNDNNQDDNDQSDNNEDNNSDEQQNDNNS